MLQALYGAAGTVVVVVLIVVAVFFAVKRLIKSKNDGNGCSGCPMAGQCHGYSEACKKKKPRQNKKSCKK